MAVSPRPSSLPKHILTLLSCLLLLLLFATDALASPLAASPSHVLPINTPDLLPHLAAVRALPAAPVPLLLRKRVAPVTVTSSDGNVTVVNPSTSQTIAQGSGSDGAGTDFSLPAILWLAFTFAAGVPLALAGIRLWRVTTGISVGLAVAVLVWSAFVNTVSADGLSDLVLTIIVLGAFVAGAVLGALDFGRWAGILLLGVLGGFSIGARVVLLRPGLLIGTYVLNWIVLAAFMIVGLATILFKQRFGLCMSGAACGTFLVGLGIDLLLEKQSGISFGLRFLLDRNNSHFLAIVHKGYHPSVMTQIILGASIGAIPILAFLQHKIFKGPFRPESSRESAELASLMESEPGLGPGADGRRSVSSTAEGELGMGEVGVTEKPVRRSRMQLMMSRFSMT